MAFENDNEQSDYLLVKGIQKFFLSNSTLSSITSIPR